jgi:hypothetical protein
MEAEALEARGRLHALEPHAGRRERSPEGAKVFRLHSARHHLECSEGRFRRLATSQADLPMLVARRDGRRWWWFLDRFWWDDDGLQPGDVKTIVLDGDLALKQHADAIARARAALLGEEAPPTPQKPVSQIVRFAVWCRDRGRCADCGSADGLGYDEILPRDEGGTGSVSNVELRCEACRERRRRNQERTRIGRAQVGAMSDLI